MNREQDEVLVSREIKAQQDRETANKQLQCDTVIAMAERALDVWEGSLGEKIRRLQTIQIKEGSCKDVEKCHGTQEGSVSWILGFRKPI